MLATVQAPADEVRAQIGNWAEVHAEPGGTCSVRIRGDSYDWAVAALGLTGAPFHVEGPPGFVAHLGRWRDRLVAAVPA